MLLEGSNPSPKMLTSEYVLVVGTQAIDHHFCRHPFFAANAVGITCVAGSIPAEVGHPANFVAQLIEQ